MRVGDCENELGDIVRDRVRETVSVRDAVGVGVTPSSGAIIPNGTPGDPTARLEPLDVIATDVPNKAPGMDL